MNEKEKQEYKEEILNEIIYLAQETHMPIDTNILEDICDEIRLDKNI